MITPLQALLHYIGMQIAGVEGDVAEIGVFDGSNFRHFVRLAMGLKRKAHAFDSFCGMAEPGRFDGTDYWKGRFNIKGIQGFKTVMYNRGFLKDQFYCWEGFIPTCFEKFDKELPNRKLALVYIDVDHYDPTRLALDWAVRKIPVGGFLALDDFLPNINSGKLATKAIAEWMLWNRDFRVKVMEKGQVILRREF